MKLFNTLSRKIEEFKPWRPPHVGVYICGPTVYDYAHIGHSRTYVNSDVLVRALRWLGFTVKVVMNITDVGHLTSDADVGEDKVEKKAREEKKTAWEIAKFYTQDFWQMAEKLNIIKPDIVVKATDEIKTMIEMIKELEKKGYTYKTSDGIYFDTSKSKDYGRLARLDLTGLKPGARVKRNLEKRQPTDFALWKFSPPDRQRQMEWPSPWGTGFPGWHIECSAMSLKYVGEQLDVHTGGVDHIPTHHTNEICQSEAVTGKQFVKYWFHSEMLTVEGKKMSKSLKNYLRLAEVEKKGFAPLALRYLFLTSHYRSKMNFTWKALRAAAEAYERLRSMAAGWQGPRARTSLSEDKLKKVQQFSLKFKELIETDLSLPQALAVVWEMAKSNIPEQDKWELISDWDQVLGLNLKQTQDLKPKTEVPPEIQTLAARREKLRQEKKWTEADKLRQEIKTRGFLIEDTPGGAVIKEKKPFLK